MKAELSRHVFRLEMSDDGSQSGADPDAGCSIDGSIDKEGGERTFEGLQSHLGFTAEADIP
ncbi:hypothetical protein RV134_350275 [Roseovarius sp. EC-HK134]|nr:hypothetical protein RV134_350275 [Roseovarius sp. EC-HK134]VVT30169.1 hypothetical protein RV420_410197 [Roseovarius sp. EC-SD190]